MTADEWRHRAEREAAAIISGATGIPRGYDYSVIVDLVAIGYLQGVSLGMHETMNDAEAAFERIRQELLA